MTWNVSYDSLLIIINNSTAVLAIGFADDVSLSKTGKVLEQVLNDLQKGINMALEWGQTWTEIQPGKDRGDTLY